MRVYGPVATGGRTLAFEVENLGLSRRVLRRILESAPGVTDLRLSGRFSGDDNRACFRFDGVDFVVWEAWGDNSRYWIGPADTNAPAPDVEPLMQAFRE